MSWGFEVLIDESEGDLSQRLLQLDGWEFQNLWECFNTSMLFGLPLHHKFHSELVGTVSHHATHWWVEVLRFLFMQISELVRMLTHRCFSVCRCTINFTQNLLEQCLITRHTDELRFWGFWFTQISELVRMLTHRCFSVCLCTINFTLNLLEQCLITRHTDELRFRLFVIWVNSSVHAVVTLRFINQQFSMRDAR